MIIGIDGNEANIESRVGVHQYAYELLWSIYRIIDKGRGGFSKIRVIVYLKDDPRSDLPSQSSFWRYKVIKGSGIWIITKLMPHIIFSKKKPDVFFTPSHYLPPVIPMPKVCTIHDLGYLKSSGQFKKYDYWQLRIWSAISIYVSKHVLAVSNSTKKDIVRHYPSALKKITVTLHGYDRKRFNQSITPNDVRRVKKRYSIVGDYLLFLSTLKPSKNLEGILAAFNKVVKNKTKTVTLVIAGKKGWLYKTIFSKVKKLKLEEKVIFTDYLPEIDKPALLFGAKMLVSPSFWEGFGMQVLEAIACGTPAIVSKVASLPEVAGKAGVYADPTDTGAIAKAMRKILVMSESEYKNLVNLGLTQAEKFSWEESAKTTLEVLKKAALN